MESPTPPAMLLNKRVDPQATSHANLAPANPRPAASVPAGAPSTGAGAHPLGVAIGPHSLFEQVVKHYTVQLHLDSEISLEQELQVSRSQKPLYGLLSSSRLMRVEITDSNIVPLELSAPPSNQQEVSFFGKVRDFEAEFGDSDRRQVTRYRVSRSEIPNRLVVTFYVCPESKVVKHFLKVLPLKVNQLLKAHLMMNADSVTHNMMLAQVERAGVSAPTFETDLLWNFCRAVTWSHILLASAACHRGFQGNSTPEHLQAIKDIITYYEVEYLLQATRMGELQFLIFTFFDTAVSSYRKTRGIIQPTTQPRTTSDVAFSSKGAQAPAASAPQPQPAPPTPTLPVVIPPEVISKEITVAHVQRQRRVETQPAQIVAPTPQPVAVRTDHVELQASPVRARPRQQQQSHGQLPQPQFALPSPYRLSANLQEQVQATLPTRQVNLRQLSPPPLSDQSSGSARPPPAPPLRTPRTPADTLPPPSRVCSIPKPLTPRPTSIERYDMRADVPTDSPSSLESSNPSALATIEPHPPPIVETSRSVGQSTLTPATVRPPEPLLPFLDRDTEQGVTSQPQDFLKFRPNKKQESLEKLHAKNSGLAKEELGKRVRQEQSQKNREAKVEADLLEVVDSVPRTKIEPEEEMKPSVIIPEVIEVESSPPQSPLVQLLTKRPPTPLAAQSDPRDRPKGRKTNSSKGPLTPSRPPPSAFLSKEVKLSRSAPGPQTVVVDHPTREKKKVSSTKRKTLSELRSGLQLLGRLPIVPVEDEDLLPLKDPPPGLLATPTKKKKKEPPDYVPPN